ncbi:MAG: HAMP domain-containing histidine kinase [Myxococcales bacterium]|nr:HAMP domain-containing histidine kinase [Myxococcales bacterium]
MSGFWRGILARIVGSAVLSAVLSSVLLVGVMLDRLSAGAIGAVATVAETRLASLETQCLAAPERFSVVSERGFHVFAYDPATGHSLNREAPPLDRDLLARNIAGDRTAAALYWTRGRGGAATILYGHEGPCALFQLGWPIEASRRWKMMRGIVAGLFIIVLITSAAIGLAAVRPLKRRIDAASRSARLVGHPSDYQYGEDVSGDVVSELRRALDRAHERICADATELERRQGVMLEYLGGVAHDLRTPQTALRLALEELSTSSIGPAERASLRAALTEASYLGALTENLHLACQLREGVDPLARGAVTDLGELVDSCAVRGALLGRAHGVEVAGARPDHAVWVSCDPTMAEQVLTNLVRNAVVHGDVGGHVAIVLEPHDDAFELRVLDDGPGVPVAELPRLEERHFRGSAAGKRDDRGSGLGLAIVAEICRRVGWSVTLGQNEPRGLSVTLRGLLAPPQARAHGATSTRASLMKCRSTDLLASSGEAE